MAPELPEPARARGPSKPARPTRPKPVHMRPNISRRLRSKERGRRHAALEYSLSPRRRSGERAGERGKLGIERPSSPHPSPPSEGGEGERRPRIGPVSRGGSDEADWTESIDIEHFIR